MRAFMSGLSFVMAVVWFMLPQLYWNSLGKWQVKDPLLWAWTHWDVIECMLWCVIGVLFGIWHSMGDQPEPKLITVREPK